MSDLDVSALDGGPKGDYELAFQKALKGSTPEDYLNAAIQALSEAPSEEAEAEANRLADTVEAYNADREAAALVTGRMDKPEQVIAEGSSQDFAGYLASRKLGSEPRLSTARKAAVESATVTDFEATLGINGKFTSQRFNQVIMGNPKINKDLMDNQTEVKRYLALGMAREEIAGARTQIVQNWVESGQVESFEEGQKSMTETLNAIRDQMGVIRKGLPELKGRARTTADGTVVGFVDSLPMPDVARSPGEGLVGKIDRGIGKLLNVQDPDAPLKASTVLRGLSDLFTLGTAGGEARGGLIFPRHEVPTSGGPRGIIPTNDQAIGEMIGKIGGWSGPFRIAGPLANAVRTGIGVATGSRIAAGTAAGVARGAQAGALSPDLELDDFSGRVRRAAEFAAIGGIVEGPIIGGAKNILTRTPKVDPVPGKTPVKAQFKTIEDAPVAPKPAPKKLVKPKVAEKLPTAPKTEGPVLLKKKVGQEPKPIEPTPVLAKKITSVAKPLEGPLSGPPAKAPAATAALSGKPPKLPDPPEGTASPASPSFRDAREAVEFIHKEAIRQPKHKVFLAEREAGRLRGLVPKRQNRNQVGEDIGAVLENNATGNIRIPNDTATKALERLKGKGQALMVRRARILLDRERGEINRFAQERLGEKGDLIRHLEDYLPHFFTGPPKMDIDKAVAKWFEKNKESVSFSGGRMTVSPKPQSSKARTFTDLAAAVASDLKLTPITQDFFKLYPMYVDRNWRTSYTNLFLKQVGDMTATADNGAVIPMVVPAKVAIRAPKGAYVQLKSPFFPSGSGFVHKEIAPVVKMVTDQPWSNKWVSGLEAVNSYVKFSNVALSGFHGVSLTESALAVSRDSFLNPLRPILTVGGKRSLGGRTLINSPIVEGFKLSRDPEARAIMDRAGLGLGHKRPDVGIGRVMAKLNELDQGISLVTAKVAKPFGPISKPIQTGLSLPIKIPIKAAQTYVNANNTILWDVMHNSWKSYYFFQWRHEFNRRIALGKESINPKTGRVWTPQEIDDDIARTMNNAFGGQEMETQYYASPKVQQFLRNMTFSLDWTSSNLKIAGDIGRKGIRGEMGRRYWAAMAASFASAQGLIQFGIYHANDGDPKQGDTPYFWENGGGDLWNPSANFWKVDMTPYFRKRGLWEKGDRRIYAGFGKQFKEILRWGANPIQEAFAKGSPLWGLSNNTFRFIGGINWGDRAASGPMSERLGALGREVQSRISPFSMNKKGNRFNPIDPQATQFMFSIPQSRGPSWTASAARMRDVLKKRVDPTAPWKDPKYVKSLFDGMDEIFDEAKKNGTIKSDDDVKQMLNTAINGSNSFIGLAQFLKSDITNAYESAKKTDAGLLQDRKAEKVIEERLLQLMLLHQNVGKVYENLYKRGVVSSEEDLAMFRELALRSEESLDAAKKRSEEK